MDSGHVPVLLTPCIEALHLRAGGIYVDATLGRGGHSEAILRERDDIRLIGIDRDDEAIAAGKRRLEGFGERVTLLHTNFDGMREALRGAGVEKVDGILMDLGVSSPQLDHTERGFSYMRDAPLDMRMDKRELLSAETIVNTWSRDELIRIFRDYGEERYAPLIAGAVIAARPVKRTGELAEIIRKALPAKALREKQHPAKRVFQALRIAVNDELGALQRALESTVDLLNPEGRLAVIAFHSLEDRIVKQFLRREAEGCRCPPSFPVCVCGHKPRMAVVTKRPLLPDEIEIETNPRARSAKLRVGERTYNP
ncbi:16S rRNA (cytosine(1402)-N(4))-methyltransferase RsmH [Oscillospiraceae bacterium OttesenSCG-928-F05]|nr:16S rRNA (cytosine(1402)-N(4))-methyltransferase RsmH [Oscillospiraceae bacterium OttesenSCG-928-F05]